MQFVTEHKWRIPNGTYIFDECKTTDSSATIIGIRFIRFKSQFISSLNNLFIDDAKLLKAIPFVWEKQIVLPMDLSDFNSSLPPTLNSILQHLDLYMDFYFVSYRTRLLQSLHQINKSVSIIQAIHFALK